MARILVTEQLAEGGLDALRAAGHDVDVRLDLTPDALLEAVDGAAALIVRSATKVTAEVVEAGRDLVVVGRAGVGVDNVDVNAATSRGVMVVNAPGSNVLSTAEHAMALLLALARNVPQADAALKLGRWEKSKWAGVELYGKTLGVFGLGRIGTLVAQRAYAFGMQLLAYDPYLAPDRARQLGATLVDTLDELFSRSDFVTIHAAKTPETIGAIGKDLLAKAKPGLRIVNAARGGIIDEQALAEALRSGAVAGAGLDVFDTEPITDSPLFELANVVVTPHLAASTPEAQDKAGAVIADQVVLALAGEFVPFAVNVEAAEASETVRPYMPLAERLGRIFAGLVGGAPGTIELEYQGELGAYDTRILTLSVLKGFFSTTTDEPVSYVNAPSLAAARGVAVRETSSTAAHDFVNLVTIRGGGHAIAGTLYGLRSEPIVVMLDDHAIHLPPAENLLVVRNDNTQGRIALVAGSLAEAGLNIANMDVGHAGDTALMVIATDDPVPVEVVDRLTGQPGILDVRAVSRA